MDVFYGFVLVVFIHWIPAFETAQEALAGCVTGGMTNIGLLRSLFCHNEAFAEKFFCLLAASITRSSITAAIAAQAFVGTAKA